MIKIGDLLVDLAISEEHTHESEATEYPVEQGSDVTDNVRPKPITITLEGLISDTPLASTRAARIAGGSALPSVQAYAALIKIRDAREPITVETSLAVFDNMLLTNLTVPRGKGDKNALRFTVTFQQLRIVANGRTFVKIPAAASGVNLGTLMATDFTDSKSRPLFYQKVRNGKGFKSQLVDINGKPVSQGEANAAVTREGNSGFKHDKNGFLLPQDSSDPTPWWRGTAFDPAFGQTEE